ncbi:MAG TPA: hypothetical protein VNZ58_06445 [Thermomicrobiales bacterium]|nr:hypothetical protein [Thermomicrobiales bacterium]
MGSTSVLLANEPRVYRETIAVAIGMLCPDKTIIVADPDKMDEFILEHHPHVVLSSRLTEILETQVSTWAVLYPDGAGETIVQRFGKRCTVQSIELTGIVNLIQRQCNPPSA